MIKRIILDTNFLLIPSQFGVDIFSEIQRIMNVKYRIYVLDKTINEIKGIIKKQKGKNRDSAKLALKMVKKFNICTIKTEGGYADNLLRKESEISNTIIATQDIVLRRSLKNVIFLRQRQYLCLREDKNVL